MIRAVKDAPSASTIPNTGNRERAAFSISNALRLVQTVKNLIGKETCIIDTQGIIIASTSEERIGQFHAAALVLIASKADQLIINEENQQDYPQCRPGVNLPIVVDEVLQGVVGISGTQQETELFGKIVQAFIQEQIHEINSTQKRMRTLEMQNAFLTRWFLDNTQAPNEGLLEQARLLHIDMNAWKSVCVLAPPQFQRSQNQTSPQNSRSEISMMDTELHHSISQVLLSFHKKNMVVDLGFYFILLIADAPPLKAKEICTYILDTFSQQLHTDLCVGIGTQVSSPQMLRQSFHEAQIACNISANESNHKILLFTDLRTDLVVHFLPKRYKDTVFDSVFRAYSQKELQETMQFLQSYIHNNGSITLVAKDMFIHKNTVQYRLHKLLETTGLDARRISDMTWLNILYKIYEAETLTQ